jgi:hypothetical protein
MALFLKNDVGGNRHGNRESFWKSAFR